MKTKKIAAKKGDRRLTSELLETADDMHQSC